MNTQIERMNRLVDIINDCADDWSYLGADQASIQVEAEAAHDELENMLDGMEGWESEELPDEEIQALMHAAVAVAEDIMDRDIEDDEE